MNIGIVGAGAISDIYLTNLTTRFPNVKVLSICANHLENAQKKAEQYNIRAVTLDEMLADPEIELLLLLTPVGTHAELIRKGLEAGKHVYSEKTIAETTEQAIPLADLAKEKGLYLGCAPDTFLGASFQTARKLLNEKKIGKVHSFSISINRNNDVLTSLFPFLRLPGAGALRDHLVYFVTALVSLLGPVDTVAAFTETPYPSRIGKYPQFSNFGQETETPNESIVSAIVRMKNGITGTIHENNESNIKEQCRFLLYGTEGILELGNPNDFGDPITLYPADPREEPVTIQEDLPYSDNSRGVGVAELAQAAEHGEVSRMDAQLAIHVLDVLESMERSSNSLSFVRLQTSCTVPDPFTGKQE
ncbi:MAG: Gfo/Idh/MocA family oxidoreductase [Oscillospiraceae bacterium]|nr:Gfo/Idh/MocA family oxidoreductase [Oscillospiraceae bacterium]